MECAGASANELAADDWNTANIATLANCAADACGGVMVTSNYDYDDLSDGCGETGSLTVTYTVTDDCGNSTSTTATFTVEDGEFFMLLGPSGCGKTTTLRMMAGLELPTSGEIYIDGAEVGQRPASQRDIAFVFQMFALYPHMNVGKNISYPLISQGMPPR